ncbi:MAG: hypothetical protein K9W44_00930 [Candidatus Lokiarchaeota archaeon]|nr:hypothetical protein [Candidatus Harpocratesius repetitus]
MINGLLFGSITGSLIFLCIGIILVIIQSINGVVEEEKMLIPKFEEKYILYKKNVPGSSNFFYLNQILSFGSIFSTIFPCIQLLFESAFLKH